MDSPFQELSIDVPNFLFFQKMAANHGIPQTVTRSASTLLASPLEIVADHTSYPGCGVQLIEGEMVRLRKKVLLVDGIRAVTVAVNLVMRQGADGCRAGFAPHHLMPHHILDYNGALARVKEVYSCRDKISNFNYQKEKGASKPRICSGGVGSKLTEEETKEKSKRLSRPSLAKKN